jgi:hypothetical protein
MHTGIIRYLAPENSRLILPVSDTFIEPGGNVTDAPTNYEVYPGTWEQVPDVFIHYLRNNAEIYPAIGDMLRKGVLSLETPMTQAQAESAWANTVGISGAMSTNPSIFHTPMGIQKVDPNAPTTAEQKMQNEIAELKAMVAALTQVKKAPEEPAPSRRRQQPQTVSLNEF